MRITGVWVIRQKVDTHLLQQLPLFLGLTRAGGADLQPLPSGFPPLDCHIVYTGLLQSLSEEARADSEQNMLLIPKEFPADAGLGWAHLLFLLTCPDLLPEWVWLPPPGLAFSLIKASALIAALRFMVGLDFYLKFIFIKLAVKLDFKQDDSEWAQAGWAELSYITNQLFKFAARPTALPPAFLLKQVMLRSEIWRLAQSALHTW